REGNVALGVAIAAAAVTDADAGPIAPAAGVPAVAATAGAAPTGAAAGGGPIGPGGSNGGAAAAGCAELLDTAVGVFTDGCSTPGAAATGACESPVDAATGGADGAVTVDGGGSEDTALDAKDAGGGKARESAAVGDAADDPPDGTPPDPAPVNKLEGDTPPPKPPNPPPPDNGNDPVDTRPPPKLGNPLGEFRSAGDVGAPAAVSGTATGGRSSPKPVAAVDFPVSPTLPTLPCPAGASGRPEPPKSSEVALDCDSVGGEGRSPSSLSTPFCLPGLSGNGPNRDARPGELPRTFFAILSGCFVAQNCGQVDTWIRGLTYGFGLDFAPWPTSPLGRRLPRWGLRASRSS